MCYAASCSLVLAKLNILNIPGKRNVGNDGVTLDSPAVSAGLEPSWRFHGGTPSHHPFLDWIFHEINQLFLGYPHDYGNLPGEVAKLDGHGAG